MISWTELRDEAVAAWGQAPGEALEDEVAAVFRERPRLVAMELARVSEAHKKAAIHSPWAVLRARLRSALRALDVVASDGEERERAVARAETWLRAAGVHVDREEELLRALFEDPGERSGPVLGRWAEDEELKARMLERWRELRRKAAA